MQRDKRAIIIVLTNRYLFKDITIQLHDKKFRAKKVSKMTGSLICRRGYFSLLKEPKLNHLFGSTECFIDYAARGNHLEIMKWLHNNKIGSCSKGAMDDAAGNGYLEIVKWLHENRTEGCTVQAMNLAARNGHLKVLKWLYKNRAESFTNCAMDDAAMNGHLNVISWFCKKGICVRKAMLFAAEYGHLHIIQYICNYYPINTPSSALRVAAFANHFDIVKWLYLNHSDNFMHGLVEDLKDKNSGNFPIYTEIINWLENSFQ